MALLRQAGRAACANEDPPDLFELVAPNGGIGAGLEPEVIEVVGAMLAAAEIIECPMQYLESAGLASELDIVNRLRRAKGAAEVSQNDLDLWTLEQ